MRYPVLLLGSLLIAGIVGCNKEDDKAKTTGTSGGTSSSSTSTDTPKMTSSGPTTDLKDIQGKWQSKEGDQQFEFGEKMLTIRTGSAGNWKEKGKYPFTLNDQVRPRQIDWGTGSDAGRGLYTIDGKTLIIKYANGGPEARPTKMDNKSAGTQLWLQQVQ